MIDIKIITNLDNKNKEISEETEAKINHITRENLELYRQIKVGKDAEKKLRENQKQLEVLMALYLGINQKERGI